MLFINLLKFKKLNRCFGRKMYKIETYYINGENITSLYHKNPEILKDEVLRKILS